MRSPKRNIRNVGCSLWLRRPRHGNFYARQFKPAVRRALPPELHGLRSHDLRHTCAALLIAEGAHPKAIQQRLGHSSITVTLDRCGHLFPGLDEALTDRLDAVYRRADVSQVRMAMRRYPDGS